MDLEVFFHSCCFLVDLKHRCVEGQSIKFSWRGALKKKSERRKYLEEDKGRVDLIIHWKIQLSVGDAQRSPSLGAIAGNSRLGQSQPLAQKGERGRIARKDRLSHSVSRPLCLQGGFINGLDNYLGIITIKRASDRLWLSWRAELEPEGRIKHQSV